MPEQNNDPNQPQEPVVYATPVKRAWAWVGVVYMVIIVLLVTYSMAKGAFLQGIGSLLVCPALGGLAATAVLRCREGRCRGGVAACVAVVVLCLGLIAVNLFLGVPALIANF